MEIKSIETNTVWLVEHEGLSYVRQMFIRNGKQFITWHSNFDESTLDASFEVLESAELERLYSENNIKDVTPVFSGESELGK